jgi:hypothetical protein
VERASRIGSGDEVDGELGGGQGGRREASRKGIHGIIRAGEEPHTTSPSLHKTPSVADLLANDSDFIACFHIQFPEFSLALEREQYSRPASVDVLLEVVIFAFVV